MLESKVTAIFVVGEIPAAQGSGDIFCNAWLHCAKRPFDKIMLIKIIVSKKILLCDFIVKIIPIFIHLISVGVGKVIFHRTFNTAHFYVRDQNK